jgi:hypothetical protein
VYKIIQAVLLRGATTTRTPSFSFLMDRWVEQVVQLHAALSISQHELVTKFLKLELDVQGVVCCVLRSEIGLSTPCKEPFELRDQGAASFGQPQPVVPSEGVPPEAGKETKLEIPLMSQRPQTLTPCPPYRS